MKMKIQETIYEMRRQPVITAVSIVGTALAIFLIMIMVMMEQVKIAPFSPESNRDRWLVNRHTSIKFKDSEGSNCGPMGFNTAKEVYYRMRTPEAVTVFGTNYVSMNEAPGSIPVNLDTKGVDDRFWRVMDFTFIDGAPFDSAQFESGANLAVISESAARSIFNASKVAGRKFRNDFVEYTVCGVVEDVSPLADMAYAEIWPSLSSIQQFNTSWADGIMGLLSAIILAKDKEDFPEIRTEFVQLHKKYIDSFGGRYEYVQLDRPYDQETSAHTRWANMGPNMKQVYTQNLIIFAILLIVPAINLSSMTHSRLRRQEEIIGVKRAFGATRANILISLFIENFIITLLAGVLGLVLAVVFSYISAGSLYGSSDFSVIMVMQWKTFGFAILFCFILNIISAGLPSLLAARTNIVNALSKR